MATERVNLNRIEMKIHNVWFGWSYFRMIRHDLGAAGVKWPAALFEGDEGKNVGILIKQHGISGHNK